MKITKSWHWKKNPRLKHLPSIMNAIETIFLLKICLTTSLRNLGPLPKWDQDQDILVVPILQVFPKHIFQDNCGYKFNICKTFGIQLLQNVICTKVSVYSKLSIFTTFQYHEGIQHDFLIDTFRTSMIICMVYKFHELCQCGV